MINNIFNSKKLVRAVFAVIVIIVGVIAYENFSWKTYVNEKYGYSIRYPSNWKVVINDPFALNIISPEDQKLMDGNYDSLGIQDKLNIFYVIAYPYREREEHISGSWKRNNVLINGKTIEKITAYGPDSTSEFVQLMNGGLEYNITFPTDDTRVKIFESFKFTVIKKIEDVVYWNTYKNEKYGFQFKYPEIYNVYSHDAVMKTHTLATPQSNNFFITSATEYQLNNVGREYGGIWLTISERKIEKPIEIISEKEIDIDGNKGTEYQTSGGVEHTGLTVIHFEKDGKYYEVKEWSVQSLLEPFISTFKFTSKI